VVWVPQAGGGSWDGAGGGEVRDSRPASGGAGGDPADGGMGRGIPLAEGRFGVVGPPEAGRWGYSACNGGG
jgi:hypothetical protein